MNETCKGSEVFFGVLKIARFEVPGVRAENQQKKVEDFENYKFHICSMSGTITPTLG